MLKAALIGAGQIAVKTHLPHITQRDDVRLVAVADTNPHSAQTVAEQFQIDKYYSDYHQMLTEQKPDFVIICVPNKFHYPIVCDALRHHCHVFCEKPPALNSNQALEMEMLAKENNVLLSYGFHLRYSEDVAIAKRMIEENCLGTLYSGHAVWTRQRGIPGWGNFTNKEIQGGGPLIDIGCHVLDLICYLLGYPEISYVSANSSDRIGKQGGTGYFGDWDGGSYSVEDYLFGFIQFNNGVSISLETAFALNMEEKDCRQVQLYGDKGAVSLYPLKFCGIEYKRTYTQNFTDFVQEDLYKKEMDGFINAVKHCAPLLVTAEQGTYVQKLIDMLYLSAEKHQPVLIAQPD
jgi:predicted dehydrogenase